MQMFTGGIGKIIAAMQKQTVALAKNQQEQQDIIGKGCVPLAAGRRSVDHVGNTCIFTSLDQVSGYW